MQRRASISPSSSWISLVDQNDDECEPEENKKTTPFYDSYPAKEIFADMLPPDYPAILSLLFSVIGICWSVLCYFVLLYRTDSSCGYPLSSFSALLRVLSSMKLIIHSVLFLLGRFVNWF